MKIAKISLLLTLFKHSSNQSKFLRYINIGLFFALFAISSALITFYIENKIDKLEFNLNEQHIIQRDTKNYLVELVQLKVLIKSLVVSDKAINNLYEYTASTKLGQYTISVDDLYLPGLFLETQDKDLTKEMTEEGLWEEFGEMLSEWYGEDSETVKNYNETLKSLYKNINFYEKDYSKYYDRLFDYNAKNLINQILTTNNSINYYDHQFQKDNKKLDILYYDMFLLLEHLEKLFFEMSAIYQEGINQINIDILKLSRNESKIIIFAFIFQFLVFIIIQYFEIMSIQTGNKKNAKRKSR
ncbi:hypothetical protein N8953_00510 [Candidatus Pelagibacter sp.]|nr:hypothetical protein [Candidatus Pelagibacter sp.]|tara:strand:- start:423 stop:1319 length:897 start_codon:yes stop_codon:yes gene_type:complete